MGDNNVTDGKDEVTPTSVSALFDDTHRKYIGIVRGEEDTSSKSVQMEIKETIRKLEDLTRQVSVLGILSENENYKEMNPSELKFIMLPFMIGNLWQLSTAIDRENVCHMSKVYFKDYLKRCFNYDVISKLPPEAQDDKEKEDEEEEEGASKSADPKRQPPKINSDNLREMKVQRFKEGKMLDVKINLYLKLHLKGESMDDEDLQKFIISLLKRNALEAEDQLRSIAQELELIKFAERMKIGSKENTSSSSTSTSQPHHHHHHPHSSQKKDATKKPPQIFILTKSEIEKQVFGAGYPAVPVMTVEELYEQRRKTGQWGPPSASVNNLPNATETDDDRDAQQEALEERDDDELLERQRRMDDYKDDHRRGWGNRYNRS